MSAARALNQITGIPLISVGTLDAFGRQEGEETDEIICPILDARRNQVYGGAYGGRETVIPGGPYMLDELLTMLEREDRICFAGDGLAAYGGRIAAWAEKKGKTVRYKEVNQHASGVALLAGEMLQNPEAFGGVTSLDHNTLEPSYMRIPEAERKLKEKKAAGKETP